MRLLIVEDNPVLLQRLAMALEGEPGITVAGAFGSAEDALEAFERAEPEVALLDLGLPGMSGIELVRAVRERFPDVDMIAHTVFEDRDTVFAALKAGASGYLLKGCSLRTLVEALHEVHTGGAPMSPHIARQVIREFQDGRERGGEYLLSPREREILKEIESGMTYKEIGAKFTISTHTVNAHLKNIYKKLHARDRREAVLAAKKKGIL